MFGIGWGQPLATFEKTPIANLDFGNGRLNLRSAPRVFRGHTLGFFVDNRDIFLQHDTMARLSRIVVPGYPHHVTQRGVRSMNVFHEESDRRE